VATIFIREGKDLGESVTNYRGEKRYKRNIGKSEGDGIRGEYTSKTFIHRGKRPEKKKKKAHKAKKPKKNARLILKRKKIEAASERRRKVRKKEIHGEQVETHAGEKKSANAGGVQL